MPKPSLRAQRYLDRVARLGCIVCRNVGQYPDWAATEIHHLREGMGMSQKNDYLHTLPLCPIHHRTGGRGVGFHAGRESWEAHFGSERSLLWEVRRLLGYKGLPR